MHLVLVVLLVGGDLFKKALAVVVSNRMGIKLAVLFLE